MPYGGPYGEMSASLRYLSQRLFTLLLVFFFNTFQLLFSSTLYTRQNKHDLYYFKISAL